MYHSGAETIHKRFMFSRSIYHVMTRTMKCPLFKNVIKDEFSLQHPTTVKLYDTEVATSNKELPSGQLCLDLYKGPSTHKFSLLG